MLSEHLCFKRGADWLDISEHKFRLLNCQPEEGKSVGTRPDQKQTPLLVRQTGDTSMLSRGGYLCYSQIKIWQEKKMTNDIRTSFSKTEGSSNYTGKKNNGLQEHKS